MTLTTLIFFPIIASILLVFIKDELKIRQFTLIASLAEIALSWPLIHFNPQGEIFQFVELIPWVPKWGMSYYLGIDGISLTMILLTVLLLPLCVLSSWTYIKSRIKEFHICLLLMTSVCIGVFCALDFVLFYVFWEAMLVPMFLLIAVWGGPRRKYASVKFIIYTLAGSTLLLVAMIAFYTQAKTFAIPEIMSQTFSFRFQYWAFLAMALAFAIKVPMFPFHTWLPAAHVEAPTAGSVILASILLKMGTYGFLRFCLPMTPDASIYFAPLMIAVSIASIIYGGMVALAQNDMKKLIAYSSVGHMGFVTLGIFMFNLAGLQGALMQMINHGITTGALFMMVGTIYERSHSREISDNRGLGKLLPAYMGFFGLFALSSLAFPGTNSFVGEVLVLIGAFKSSYVVGALAIPGALLAATYMLRLLQKMAWGEPSSVKGWKDLNLREWVYLVPLAVLVIYLGLAPGLTLRTVNASLSQTISKIETIQQNNAAIALQLKSEVR